MTGGVVIEGCTVQESAFQICCLLPEGAGLSPRSSSRPCAALANVFYFKFPRFVFSAHTAANISSESVLLRTTTTTAKILSHFYANVPEYGTHWRLPHVTIIPESPPYIHFSAGSSQETITSNQISISKHTKNTQKAI